MDVAEGDAVRRTRALIAAGALLVLGTVDVSIAMKERIKRNGEVVLVDLGPRDPRSLMQGDYMALNFPLSQRISAAWSATAAPREGELRTAYIVVDERRVASLASAGAPGALPLRYRVRNGQAWIGTDAFFFEEGSARRYAPARYGEFRLDPSTGEGVLVGLRDAKLRPLGP
jgi:uncharacterized membrane-anchored protein